MEKKKNLHRSETRTAWLFCMPVIILISVFTIIPFLMSVSYSFTNKLLYPKPNVTTKFIGIQNYLKLLTSSTTMGALKNTFLYSLMVVPAIIILGTVLAVLVNTELKGVKTFRMIYFSPQVVTMTVVAVIWSFFLAPNNYGLVNSFIGLFGIPAQRWLQDKNQALFCIAVMDIWQNLGMQMLIILGGLQYISGELYEAAMMDGCNSWQKFWNITVPGLKYTLIYVSVSMTIGALKLFTQVYVLTNGGPQDSTTTVVYLLYKAGFINGQLGYSSAISVVFFIIVMIISELQNKVLEGK